MFYKLAYLESFLFYVILYLWYYTIKFINKDVDYLFIKFILFNLNLNFYFVYKIIFNQFRSYFEYNNMMVCNITIGILGIWKSQPLIRVIQILFEMFKKKRLPALLTSQMTTMAPRLANLRAVNLPKPPPPPVTRVISPAMLFILYFNGMNNLMILSMLKITVQKRKTITVLTITKNDIFVAFFLIKFLYLFQLYLNVLSLHCDSSVKLRSIRMA